MEKKKINRSLFEMVKEEHERKARADLVNNFVEYAQGYLAVTGASIIYNHLDEENIDVRLKRVQKKLIGTLGEFKGVLTPDDYLHLGEFVRQSVEECSEMLNTMARNSRNPDYIKKTVIKELLNMVGGEDDED